MKKFTVCSLQFAVYVILLGALLAGCTVRTYKSTRDRVDQEVSGNQGYIMGSAPQSAQQPRKFTQRTTRVVEIELRSPVNFEKMKEEPAAPAAKAATEDTYFEGNQGYLTGQKEEFKPIEISPEGLATATKEVTYDTYTVKKNDTLQKIAARPEIYGTTKKWMKIFNANKEHLKSPDKIYPGQKLRIPRE